jgi:prolipoprotein diacylglyceryl transferase
MNNLVTIFWDVTPTIFDVGPLSIRWYGLLYAMTFLVGLLLLQRMFRYEKVDPTWADSVFLSMIFGVIIGARLGHCFFYDPMYYLSNPAKIFKIWEGGLASHGGAIGIILALWIFSKKISKRSILWILDRVVPMVALGGLFIRTGNLMNSEIIGNPTDLPWGFIFASVDNIPRHPTQIYEALLYTTIFILLGYFYLKTEKKDHHGFMFGLFMALAFLGRFLIEFVKENQEAFEEGMVLNMGQLLSIPFIIFGIYFIFRKTEKKVYPPYKVVVDKNTQKNGKKK